jgi:hypothetical protein
MTHRAQQVVDAMRANITANAVVNWTVYRQRIDGLDVSELELPAVSVTFAADLPFNALGPTNLNFLDSLQSVDVILVAEGASEDDVVVALMEMRKQSHIAVSVDRTQGLAFVIDTRYGGADAPLLNASADRFAGSLKTLWHVYYRMNVLDPS